MTKRPHSSDYKPAMQALYTGLQDGRGTQIVTGLTEEQLRWAWERTLSVPLYIRPESADALEISLQPFPDFELPSAPVASWRIEQYEGRPTARPYNQAGLPMGWHIAIEPQMRRPTSIPHEVWEEGMAWWTRSHF